MFINRKNDGTVKMTRQRATSKPHHLGMTGGNETLSRYLTAEKKTPKEMAAERLRKIASRKPHMKPAQVIQNNEDVIIRLMWDKEHGFERWIFEKTLVKDGSTQRSLVFPSKFFAMEIHKRNKIIWE
jgi:hypothetical protein